MLLHYMTKIEPFCACAVNFGLFYVVLFQRKYIVYIISLIYVAVQIMATALKSCSSSATLKHFSTCTQTHFCSYMSNLLTLNCHRTCLFYIVGVLHKCASISSFGILKGNFFLHFLTLGKKK